MSLSHILKSAQKLGMPVVITDREGSNAQVVMPFDDFVALTNSVAGEGKRGVASGSMDEIDLDRFTDGLPEERQMDFSIGDLDKEIQDEMEKATDQFPAFSNEDPFTVDKAEQGSGSMEEKFYLEPLEGEESR